MRKTWATHTWEGVTYELKETTAGNRWWEIPTVLPGRRFWFLVDAEEAAKGKQAEAERLADLKGA